MATLEADIERAKRAMARLVQQIMEQQRLLRALEDWAGRLGMDSEQGRRAKQGFEDEISKKQEHIRALQELLDLEHIRLKRLEDALRRRDSGRVLPA